MDADRLFGPDRAEAYDQGVRAMVPGYEALHDVAHALLRVALGEQARLLIVGAGTGTEILGLGEHNLEWRFAGVDPSPDMLAVARRRVAMRGLSDRVALHTGRTQDLPDSGHFDAATSILVMHFLADDGQKLAFLRSIAARLGTGAPVVLADLCGDATSPGFARFLAAWWRRQLASGMPERDVEEAFRQMLSQVAFVPEQRIVALLREAGFRSVERFYGALLLGGWLACRSGDT